MSDTCNWGQHLFNIRNSDANWLDVGGIYIFTKINPTTKKWHPLYIGQASSLKDRLASHERWDEALKKGATHIHAMAVSKQADRDTIEASLIETYQPTMNEQLK